jgi:hypothetical protein
MKTTTTAAPDSFQTWLLEQIRPVLGRQRLEPPWILWCDPTGEWRDLLAACAYAAPFELWADPAEHELAVRDRLFRSQRAPRVVWRRIAREELSWFKVWELDAELVWERPLVQALREYGVEIAREDEAQLRSLLPAHAREWLALPRARWQELTPGEAKRTLVDDDKILEVLAGSVNFEALRADDRFAIFSRRVTEDFGLPSPAEKNEDQWRLNATAVLLCTEAAHKNPSAPPQDRTFVIPTGQPRTEAIRLLRRWQSDLHLSPRFERLAQEADARSGLQAWAASLEGMPGSFASPIVERTVFRRLTERFAGIEDLAVVCHALDEAAAGIQARVSAFWGRAAQQRVPWRELSRLAEIAGLLGEHAKVDHGWRSVGDAVSWYEDYGWHIDVAGEWLFQASEAGGALATLKDRLRRGWLRHTDRVGRAFSELLAAEPEAMLVLPTAGERARSALAGERQPTALIFVDAFRYALGRQLAERLNTTGQVARAEVLSAVAPLPSITALGMGFALPTTRGSLHVSVGQNEQFLVAIDGFDGNLSIASERRRWLTQTLGIKDTLAIADVLGGATIPKAGRTRMIAVFGDEFDLAGHDGQLELTGAEQLLDFHLRVVNRLREAGYTRQVIVTDHGYFHWQPEADEIDATKPSGEVRRSSRRAIIGRDLEHPTALKFRVSQSDLNVLVPRGVGAFKAYGGLGYFHGGATLQELLIPVVVIAWPAKANKTAVVLKPIGHIASLAPRIQMEAAVPQGNLYGVDDRLLARRVLVKVHDDTGRVVFRSTDPCTIDPSGGVVDIRLELPEPRVSLPLDSPLVVIVRDADDEEELARERVELKVDIDEW